MTMLFQKCAKFYCGRTYLLERFSPCFSAVHEIGKITCPYCGAEHEADCHFGYRTNALPPEVDEWLSLLE
jgi:hypothetical protein